MSPSLLLVRHGSTSLNERSRFQGRIDPSLSDRGREEAARAGRDLALAGRRGVRLWSSDRRRALETAELLGAGTPKVDGRLAELDFGLFEGCTWEEATALAPRALAAWVDDPWDSPPPGGESLHALIERVGGWLDALDQGDGITHVAVTHAGPVAACLHLLLGRSWRDAFDGRPAPAGVVRLRRRAERWETAP